MSQYTGSPMLGKNSWLRKGAAKDYAGSEVATYSNVLQKAGTVLGVALLAVMLGWFIQSPALALGSAIASLVLSIIIGMKHSTNPVLVSVGAACYGFAIGAISAMFNAKYPGIVNQAILATMVVVGITYCLYNFAGFRTNPKLRKVLYICLASYTAYILITLGLSIFGFSSWEFESKVQIFGLPLGVIIGAFAIVMGAICLITDFESIEAAVKSGAPARIGWYVGYGLVMTILWLYIEILRVIALLNQK